MKSVMLKNWAHNSAPAIERSAFNLSSGHKTAFNASYLVPIFVDWALPGDTWHMNPHYFARLATPTVPIMDNLWFNTFWFSIPERILVEQWNHIMGEQEDENIEAPIDYLYPVMDWSLKQTNQYIDVGEMGDYFGLPIEKAPIVANAGPFRAYNKIFNDWFCAQNIQTKAVINTGVGPDDPDQYPLRRRAKRHDYFTSCLKWPQKGPDVMLPLGTSAPVLGNGNAIRFTDGVQSQWLYNQAGVDDNPATMSTEALSVMTLGQAVTPVTPGQWNKAIGIAASMATPSQSGLVADLTRATAANINSIREAFQLQRMLERDARSGTRLSEIIFGHFNVRVPDFRAQRSEYLNSASTRININPVAQTSGTPTAAGVESATPQGNLAAYGVVSSQDGGWSKSFHEHSIVMCIAQVSADLTYQQGKNRHWWKRERLDYYWPSLAHLGEQEVPVGEMYYTGTANDDEEVFGYQERYSEYRYKPSIITGILRSAASPNLDVWHLSEYFATAPELNEDFIEDQTDSILERNLAVTNEPQILLDCYFDLKAVRPMPTYATPGLVDHL